MTVTGRGNSLHRRFFALLAWDAIQYRGRDAWIDGLYGDNGIGKGSALKGLLDCRMAKRASGIARVCETIASGISFLGDGAQGLGKDASGDACQEGRA